MMQPLIADFPAQEFADLERRPPEDLAATQGRLLAEHIRHAAAHSPFYRRLFEQQSICLKDIRSVDDLAEMPCTDKADLSEHNADFLAVPSEDIVDVCLTSATTTNTPTQLAQTPSDLARLAYNEQQAFGMLGLGPNDTMLVAAALDRCFMAGLAYFLGGTRCGARMVRGGAGNAAQHWQLIQTTRPTVIVGVPSLMRRIAEHALDVGGNPATSGVTRLAAIGEPTRDAGLGLLPAAERTEALWNAPIYSTYASTEIATTFCECGRRQGGHVRPELIVVEILDADGRRVPDGTAGEVVVTPLGVRGMPLIRFRTGDVSFLISEPCGCGRTTPRLAPILGRKNQMLKFKGTTVYPTAILSALEGREGIGGAYVEVRRADDGTDRVTACVSVRNAEMTAERIAEVLRAHVRVAPEVILVSQEQLEVTTRQPGKRKRVTFLDLRS